MSFFEFETTDVIYSICTKLFSSLFLWKKENVRHSPSRRKLICELETITHQFILCTIFLNFSSFLCRYKILFLRAPRFGDCRLKLSVWIDRHIRQLKNSSKNSLGNRISKSCELKIIRNSRKIDWDSLKNSCRVTLISINKFRNIFNNFIRFSHLKKCKSMSWTEQRKVNEGNSVLWIHSSLVFPTQK